MSSKIKQLITIGLAVFLVIAFVVPAAAQPSPPSGALTGPERKQLQTYAGATWQSFLAMVYPSTGLPGDSVTADRVVANYTSPTNIAAYVWSTLAARDLQIITPAEARTRLGQTLTTLSNMERHAPSGMFYNWYDPSTGAKLTVWPPDGSHVYPFLSAVDNGWLATALIMVTNAVPQLSGQAHAIVSGMNFKCFLNPANNLIKGGFWLPNDQPPGVNPLGDFCGMGQQVAYTGYDNGTLNTEPRIASYIGISEGQLPPAQYFAMFRTFPNTCDWSWQEMAPVGVNRTYLGINVFEGHYTYAGMNFVPSWGGSMFESLMPTLFVPEEQWGPQSWGINHPIYVQGQIYHGLNDAKYGYWGFSPSSDTIGGYQAFGVDAMGMNPDGYPSDLQNTLVDYGFKDPSGTGYCPGRDPKPLPTSYGDGIVTPHATFLALRFAQQAAFSNIDKLQSNFPALYSWGGFFDAVDVRNGQVAQRYLALDQGMIMAALGNALRNDDMRNYFTQGAVRQAIRPILSMEQFTAGPGQ